MQQSNVIFAAILVAYILLITQKGELQNYVTLLRGGGQINQAATSSAQSSGLIDPGQFVNNAGIASDIPGAVTSVAQ